MKLFRRKHRIRSYLSYKSFCLIVTLAAVSKLTLVYIDFEDIYFDNDDLPTLYEAYGGSSVESGLIAEGDEFSLNGQPIRLYSGSIHYFRVHPDYWKDRLRKLRAAGFNTVDTYVVWNLHEPQRGKYTFDGWLNIRKFIQIAQEEDLLVILRPGPYICAEWDFGGMPSWLLRDPSMKVRSTYPGFFQPAQEFLYQVAVQVRDLQWSGQYGAQPIIAVQVENEYGSLRGRGQQSKSYLEMLKNRMEESGLTHALYFTSDNVNGLHSRIGSIPGVLRTLHFKMGAREKLETLQQLQPDRPRMVMELWPGWFDHWLEPHQTISPDDFGTTLKETLEMGASFNVYMFHGGTTFGFMPGANPAGPIIKQKSTVNSYDYDALLTEAGDYTQKYEIAARLIKSYRIHPRLKVPRRPVEGTKAAYGDLQIQEFLPLSSIVDQMQALHLHSDPVNMESVEINNGNGQSYGYILYRKKDIRKNTASNIGCSAIIADYVYMMANGKMLTKAPLTAREAIKKRNLSAKDFQLIMDDNVELSQLDLLVENMGRINWGISKKSLLRKGIYNGSVYLQDEKLSGWMAYPLQFQQSWLQSLKGWKTYNKEIVTEPALYKTVLHIRSKRPQDTFLELPSWNKGLIFLNSFNIGRYWNLGPTKTSYLPGPLFKSGKNEIVVFELFEPGKKIKLVSKPNLG